MHPKMLVLSHAEQQQAAEHIHQLMAEGMSSAEAIARVAAEIRTNHQNGQVYLVFDEED